MELSFYEARNLGHNYIGTGIVLALIREGEGVAARIIKRSWNNLRMSEQLIKALKGGQPTRGTEKPEDDTPTLDQFSVI